MALIKCKECGKKFSDQAHACPNCGAPIPPPELTWIEKVNIEVVRVKKSEDDERERISKLPPEEQKRLKQESKDVAIAGIIGIVLLVGIMIYNYLEYPSFFKLEYPSFFKSDPEPAPITAEQVRAKESQDLLWSQFSKSDGSHATLVAKVKNSMNNPDSFEHVDTVYYWTDETKHSAGDKITVKMTYRGTNGFGGVVTETVIAQVDTHGNVLQILR